MTSLIDEFRELFFERADHLAVSLAQELPCFFAELIRELEADALPALLQFVNGLGLQVAVELHLHNVDMTLPVTRPQIQSTSKRCE